MTDSTKGNAEFPTYNWSTQQISFIMSSLFLGFIFTQIPGGICTRRYGVKINLFIITFGTCISNALVPLCLSWGDWKIFCLLRFVEGLFQACANSACLQHLANWAPHTELNLLNGLHYIGFESGSIIALFLCGFISKSSYGWPGVFYITSLLCLLWCILWCIFGENNAVVSKFISAEERTYIENSLKGHIDFEKHNLPIPWNAILHSVPFWAILTVRVTDNLSFFTIHTELPAFMSGVLKTEIAEDALYSALPLMCSLTLALLCIFSADFIINRKMLSKTVLRKTCNSIAMWTPAIAIVSIGFIDAEQHAALIIFMLTVGLGLGPFIIFGCISGTVDIAPNHTEIVMAIIEFSCCFSLLLGPILAGVIVSDVTDRTQWRILFGIFAASFIIGDLVYLKWGSCEQQPWNDADYMQKQKEKKAQKSKQPIELTVLENGVEENKENKM